MGGDRCRRFWFECPHPQTGEPLRVEGVYYSARRGLRDSRGVALEPDEGEEIVLRRVWSATGQPLAFSDFEEDLVERASREIRAGRGGTSK